MEGRRSRVKWFHPRRSDVLFVMGATAFFTEVLGPDLPSNSVIIASLVLMGVPVVNRVTNRDDKDKS